MTFVIKLYVYWIGHRGSPTSTQWTSPLTPLTLTTASTLDNIIIIIIITTTTATITTYRAVGMLELDVELSSSTHYGHETLRHVAIDNRSVCQTLLGRVAVLVNDPTHVIIIIALSSSSSASNPETNPPFVSVNTMKI